MALDPAVRRDTVAERLQRAAIILGSACVTLTMLVAGDGLALWHAILFAIVLILAALVPTRLTEPHRGQREVTAETERADSVDAVIGAMSDPAILLDASGRVLHRNAGAAHLVPALRIAEPAQYALRAPEILAALREVPVTSRGQRVPYHVHGAVERWMEIAVTSLALPAPAGGRQTCVLLTFHDQTPLRRMEEMRADFIANASHELRTPLAALSGFIDTIKGPARDDAAARERFLGIMQTQASRMARLIDDLLSLSRVELAAHRPPVATVDVALLVRDVVDGLEALAAERGVRIDVDLPSDALPVTGDREELLRLFENLIENALKYGASGGRVLVSHVPGDDAVTRIAVRDFGAGIAPEHLPRLTERFYRVNAGDSRAQGGTGLGLALVKHIVARHRGKLSIDSVQGQGATFTVALPRATKRA